jgi:hypothetical protein
MTASLETLVVAAYVFADSLSIPGTGPSGKITDKELIALAVAQAATGLCSDRQFLGVIGRLLPGWFAHLPDQTQYNRRLRRLTPYITTVQLMVAELIAEGRVRLADGTLIGCANYAGCAYCPSKSLFVWGVRLVLVSDIKGVPTGYELVPAGDKEYEPVFRLVCAAERRLARLPPAGIRSELGQDVELEIVGLGQVDALVEVALMHADLSARSRV